MTNRDDERNYRNMPDLFLPPRPMGKEVGNMSQPNPSNQTVGNTGQSSFIGYHNQHIHNTFQLYYPLLSFQLDRLSPEFKTEVLGLINENQSLQYQKSVLLRKKGELQQENNILQDENLDLQQKNNVLRQNNLNLNQEFQVQIDNKRITSEGVNNRTNNGTNTVHNHCNDFPVNSDQNQLQHELSPSVPAAGTSQDLNNKNNVDAAQNVIISSPMTFMKTLEVQIHSSSTDHECSLSPITPFTTSPYLNNRDDDDATQDETISTPTALMKTAEVPIRSSFDGNVCDSSHQRPITILRNVERPSSQHTKDNGNESPLKWVEKYFESEEMKGLQTRTKEKSDWKPPEHSESKLVNAILKRSDDIRKRNRGEGRSKIEDAVEINGRSKRMKRSKENIDACPTDLLPIEEAKERKNKSRRFSSLETTLTTLRRKDMLEMFFQSVPVLENYLRLQGRKIEDDNKLFVENDQAIVDLQQKSKTAETAAQSDLDKEADWLDHTPDYFSDPNDFEA